MDQDTTISTKGSIKKAVAEGRAVVIATYNSVDHLVKDRLQIFSSKDEADKVSAIDTEERKDGDRYWTWGYKPHVEYALEISKRKVK